MGLNSDSAEEDAWSPRAPTPKEATSKAKATSSPTYAKVDPECTAAVNLLAMSHKVSAQPGSHTASGSQHSAHGRALPAAVANTASSQVRALPVSGPGSWLLRLGLASRCRLSACIPRPVHPGHGGCCRQHLLCKQSDAHGRCRMRARLVQRWRRRRSTPSRRASRCWRPPQLQQLQQQQALLQQMHELERQAVVAEAAVAAVAQVPHCQSVTCTWLHPPA